MRRGTKPTKAKVNAKPAGTRKSLKNQGSKVRDLEKRLAEALEQLQTRNRELAESQEQQTATAEILRIISEQVAIDIRERIVAGGSVPVDPRLSVEQWSAGFRQDLEQWAKVAKAANVTAEGQ